MGKILRLSIKAKMGIAFVLIFLLLGVLFNVWDYRRISLLIIDRNTGKYQGDTSVSLRQRISADLSSVKHVEPSIAEDLNTVLRWLITSTILSAVLAGVIFYVCLIILMGPLQRIIEAVKAFDGKEGFNEIPFKSSGDDVHRLGLNINNMIRKLEKTSQIQRNFFASASHELKTPLAVLRTQLEVALSTKQYSGLTRSFLINQLEEICRLQEIVAEFLVVSQLQAKTLSIHKVPFDLSVLVLNVFNQSVEMFEYKKLDTSIVFDKECEDFQIYADEDMIRIVLNNVIENASKYSVGGTSIVCTVTCDAILKRFIVKISNVIEAQSIDTEHLRVAFYRSDSNEKGSGLGLWLCDQIIMMHNGIFEIRSSDHQFILSIYLPS